MSVPRGSKGFAPPQGDGDSASSSTGRAYQQPLQQLAPEVTGGSLQGLRSEGQYRGQSVGDGLHRRHSGEHDGGGDRGRDQQEHGGGGASARGEVRPQIRHPSREEAARGGVWQGTNIR